jgi:hypothetical protein
VHEDFAVESMAGDIFQLGNTSYRVLRVERGVVRVEDAQGLPPTLPFWLGEAPGRSDELSFAVSRLRDEVASRLAGPASASTGVRHGEQVREALSPDTVGGEGWVRGQRVHGSEALEEIGRLPLTPAISPIASCAGDGASTSSSFGPLSEGENLKPLSCRERGWSEGPESTRRDGVAEPSSGAARHLLPVGEGNEGAGHW